MRVSLQHCFAPLPPPDPAAVKLRPAPLLSPSGAQLVLGSHQGADGLAAPVCPSPATLFGPRGACLAAEDGPLFIADTGHHRVMIWRRCPARDNEPAEMLIGQPDFTSEGRNARTDIGPATLNVPTGVAATDGVLAVADAWNHRILIWHGYPQSSNQPADVVLGQKDFLSGYANQGRDRPDAASLNWCYGVTIADGRLFVADTGNRRVLMWDRIPKENGTPANLVLGQAYFACRDDNAGEGVSAMGMRWPHAVAYARGMLMVADAGNNRVMVWRSMPKRNGTLCDFVLGQPGFRTQQNNAGAYSPTAKTVNMPYSVAALDQRIVVADTANSRLIGFAPEDLAMGGSATRLAGQNHFMDKGDNRWGMPSRDSLCWPYNITSCGKRLLVADSGNNRVLMWEAAA